jgi:hypothetical protein
MGKNGPWRILRFFLQKLIFLGFCTKNWKIVQFHHVDVTGNYAISAIVQYGTHHSYVLVVHTLRVAENEILKLDLPAKRH